MIEKYRRIPSCKTYSMLVEVPTTLMVLAAAIYGADFCSMFIERGTGILACAVLSQRSLAEKPDPNKGMFHPREAKKLLPVAIKQARGNGRRSRSPAPHRPPRP
jgi:hypothetical protein